MTALTKSSFGESVALAFPEQASSGFTPLSLEPFDIAVDCFAELRDVLVRKRDGGVGLAQRMAEFLERMAVSGDEWVEYTLDTT